MDGENVENPVDLIQDASVVDVKLDETIFKELDKNIDQLIETMLEKELTETSRGDSVEELITILKDRELAELEKAEALEKQELLAAEEQALLDAETLKEQELLDAEALENGEEIGLGDIYKTLQNTNPDGKTLDDIAIYLDYIDYKFNILSAEQMPALIEETALMNQKMDVMIEQNHIIGVYGIIVIPALVIVFTLWKLIRPFLP